MRSKTAASEHIQKIRNYLQSLKVLINSDIDLMTSCYEIVGALEESIGEFIESGLAPDALKDERKNRPLIQYIHNLLETRETFSREIDIETLKLYIVLNESDIFDWSLHGSSTFQFIRAKKIAIICVILSAAVLAVLATQFLKDRRADVWRVTYFKDHELKGTRYAPYFYKELMFEWEDKSPINASRLDSFSLIAYSCLKVEKGGGDFLFQLASDDGSRLYINRKLRGGNWVSQKETITEIPVRLKQGLHLVEIHYFDAGGYGSLKLNVATADRELATSDETYFAKPFINSSSSVRCSEE